jgi:xylan 1,4-beta-xylosidase
MRIEPNADARADFEQRIYERQDTSTGAENVPDLPSPDSVRATAGVGHIRLEWAPVAGAAGYVIARRESPDADFDVLRHGGSDVPAIPDHAFADTALADGTDYEYRVGAVAGAEHPAQTWSAPVTAQTAAGPAAPLDAHVDAGTVTGAVKPLWRMIGSERLSQLLLTGRQQHIADEFREALRRVHDDIGVTHVRAHAILHDDNRVAHRDATGRLSFDFTRVDAIYDQLAAIGLKPVVELSFMPAALARKATETVFTYHGIISPPADWAEWRDLITALAQHLVDRYGIDEVAGWPFEVWNEPNLSVFWTGSREEYMRLYDESAEAVKSVDERLQIGGPSTAAGEWVGALAAHASGGGTPMDFATTHTYGNLPLDLRPALAANGVGEVPIWWTEWGVGSTHFGPIHDRVFGAPFVLSGYASAQDHLDALAYWVASDHFEELGRPPRLFHNGFGLLTVGNLAKPRYWAAHLAAHQGEQALASTIDGDGAGVLTRIWATRHTGTSQIDVLLWHGSINAALIDGDPRLDRTIHLTVAGLGDETYQARLARIDETNSNIAAHCPAGVIWPDDALWDALRAHNTLSEVDCADVVPDNGTASVQVTLPLPGVVRIRLTPQRESTAREEKQ